ncbi:hypothetical protein ACYJW8_13370 [Frateuria aurantia]
MVFTRANSDWVSFGLDHPDTVLAFVILAATMGSSFDYSRWKYSQPKGGDISFQSYLRHLKGVDPKSYRRVMASQVVGCLAGLYLLISVFIHHKA